MGHSTYPEYVSVDNIFGQIPLKWRVERLHDVAELKTSNVDKKSKKDQATVRLCNYVDVYYNSKITSDIKFMVSTASENEIKKFSLKCGDVVFTKDSEDPLDIGIPTLIAQDIDELVCGYHLTLTRPDTIQIMGEFAYYALEAELSKFQFTLASNGVTRFGLTSHATKNIQICIPPLGEQNRIAEFLDYKTDQIDRLIEKKKALIEKLTEKRIAVITQAVTKGLDPTVPMRDSEVEWLGEVPEHWLCIKLRFLLKEKFVNGVFKKAEHWGKGIRIVNVTDLYVHNDLIVEKKLERLECDTDEIEKFSALHGDFFLVRSSLKLEGIGKSASIIKPAEETVFECHIVRGRPNMEMIDPRFLNLYLNSKFSHDYFISRSNQVTMATIDQDKFKTLTVSLPPYSEQVKIVSKVDEELLRIDTMVNAANKIIERFKEYRTALITAAVTGKIDVRTVQVPDQEPN